MKIILNNNINNPLINRVFVFGLGINDSIFIIKSTINSSVLVIKYRD